ncbi:MAG: hydrogenase maturation nickel metallochaperone HypA [Deltaproteobacteria bacterium]|nr:hydrogenase maturation nickel metallochaperone HypA [Deltaproteobacteria bacterium]
MHEMALAQSVVDIALAQAGGAKVRVVRLSIGALSHVDPRALEFGFEVVAKGTDAENAKLEVDRPPGVAWCMGCSRSVEVAAHGEPCSRCGGYHWVLTSGDEMRVVELEVS